MKKADKVIITCAVTGSIHTPTMSEYLPVTPEQIAADSVAAAEAGASIIHLHARDPEAGAKRPVSMPFGITSARFTQAARASPRASAVETAVTLS